MRFAGDRYRAQGFRNNSYRGPSGSIGGYRPQSGSAGMLGAMTQFQAPNAQQIAFTQMPAIKEPSHTAKSGAIGSFSAPLRI